jgi:hypothetical protein
MSDTACKQVRWGWYYQDSSVNATSTDLWEILFAAVEEANEDDRLDRLRVGLMCDLSVDDLLTSDDVISLAQDGRLSPDEIVDVVNARAGERIAGGHAYLATADAKIAFRRVIQAHTNEINGADDVVLWAQEYITLDPSTYCDGRNPLPIEYVEGEWRCGCKDVEPPPAGACIVFTPEPSPETGDVGWCWWAFGQMGSARTLMEARERCEAIISRALGLGDE